MLVSGDLAAVNGQSTVRNWNLSILSDAKTFRASNTAQGTGRQKGIQDFNGSFQAYGACPVIFPRDFFTFKGYTGALTGVAGTPGPTYTGPAIVDSIAMAFNWGTGDPLGYTLNFSGNGAIVETSEVVQDLTAPDVPPFDGASIAVDSDGSSGSATFEEWCDLLTATLTITAANTANSNSCSGSWRVRKPGPIDWTLSVVVQNASVSSMPFQLRQDVPLRLYTSPTEFWRLIWAHVVNISGITGNTETGEIVQGTVEFAKSGFVNGQRGTIVAPDGTVVW